VEVQVGKAKYEQDEKNKQNNCKRDDRKIDKNL
jgi:hypothetical protein